MVRLHCYQLGGFFQMKQQNKKEVQTSTQQSVSQLEIAKLIAEQIALPLEMITRIIELEQKLTMIKVKEGCRVVKKNYLTITPHKTPARKFHSKLTNKQYDIAEGVTIRIVAGNGFKSFVNPHKRMKPKLCRFVDSEKSE